MRVDKGGDLREVVLDVEYLSDCVRGPAFNHIGNHLATTIKKSLDIQIICGLKCKNVSDRGERTTMI